MQNYRNLAVWSKAQALAVRVHQVTAVLRRFDHGDFVSQSRRAALSISSNIAEGCGRSSNRDFARFLHNAIASANELEAQLDFGAATKLISDHDRDTLQPLVRQVRRMLCGLLKRVKGG